MELQEQGTAADDASTSSYKYLEYLFSILCALVLKIAGNLLNFLENNFNKVFCWTINSYIFGLWYMALLHSACASNHDSKGKLCSLWSKFTFSFHIINSFLACGECYVGALLDIFWDYPSFCLYLPPQSSWDITFSGLPFKFHNQEEGKV